VNAAKRVVVEGPGRTVRACAVAAAVAGALLVADAGRIHAKAVVAQVLLRSAWARTADSVTPNHPWPWADSWPVARIVVERLGVDQIVLADAGGESLAFGPSHVAGSAAPGAPGIVVVSGHRDTHFRWLPELRAGDRVEVETAGGRVRAYRVDRGRVARLGPDGDLVVSVGGAEDALVMITCDPGDDRAVGLASRYVVTAVPVLGRPRSPGNVRRDGDLTRTTRRRVPARQRVTWR